MPAQIAETAARAVTGSMIFPYSLKAMVSKVRMMLAAEPIKMVSMRLSLALLASNCSSIFSYRMAQTASCVSSRDSTVATAYPFLKAVEVQPNQGHGGDQHQASPLPLANPLVPVGM